MKDGQILRTVAIVQSAYLNAEKKNTIICF